MEVFKQIPADLDAYEGDLVVAVVGEDERPLRACNAWLDWRLYGTLSGLLVRGVFTGKLGEQCLLPTYGRFNFDRLVLIGGGPLQDDSVYPSEETGRERWMTIGNKISETIVSLKVESVGLSLPRFELADHERALLRTLKSTRLPSSTSLFISRVAEHGGISSANR